MKKELVAPIGFFAQALVLLCQIKILSQSLITLDLLDLAREAGVSVKPRA